MKAIATVVLIWWSCIVAAAPVSVDVKGVTIAQFAELVFKSILKRDFVLGEGVGTSEAKVSVTVRQMESAEFLPFVASVLDGYGFAVDSSGPVVRVVKRTGRVEAMPIEPARPEVTGLSVERVPPVIGAQPEKEPELVQAYFVQHRSVESLAEVAKAAGVGVAAPKGMGVLVLSGSAQKLGVALDLMRAVDRSAGLVDVRAAVIEYSGTQESGQAFAAVASVLGGRLALKLDLGKGAGNSLSLKGANFEAIISALAGDSRFHQIAEPRLRVLDGVRARILVGSDFPVRGSSTVDKAGNVVASVEYKQAGVILDLLPQVLEKSVLLGVHQQVSSVAITTSSGIDSPSLNKREVQTTVEMVPGEVVMLAGLDNATETETSSGFGFLPDFMRASSRNKQRTQIFLLLEVTRGAGSTAGSSS